MITTCTAQTLPQRAPRSVDSRSGLASSLVGVGDVSKRILLGRKLRSSQLGETLLPKRIALPVFASDALSSVAYAPDEIFIMLSVAGASAYVWSWKIGIAVALVMTAVVMSYRQTVHAYPSGGGDYEVATVNLGRNAGVTVASALLVDYVLTVAVSISSGAQYAASAIPVLSGHEATFAVALVVLLTALNLRGIRESGTFFAVPTYLFMIAILGMCAYGMIQYFVRHPAAGRERRPPASSRRPATTSQLTTIGADPPAGPGVLVGLCRADRCRGDLQRGAGVPQAQESKNAATTLLLLGDDRDHDDDEHHRAGQPDGDPLRRPPRPRPADAPGRHPGRRRTTTSTR